MRFSDFSFFFKMLYFSTKLRWVFGIFTGDPASTESKEYSFHDSLPEICYILTEF